MTAANILLAVGDCSDFRSAGHLAAYAGIAPVTRRSGTSIRGEFPARSGNKRLKNALFYSAFASIRFHEPSKTYYERKRAEGKRHNAEIICLARRRCNVIYAMLTRAEFFLGCSCQSGCLIPCQHDQLVNNVPVDQPTTHAQHQDQQLPPKRLPEYRAYLLTKT